MKAGPVISDRQIQLRDGRILAYAEFGLPTGKPVFLFNGTASRLFVPMDASIATDYQARLITVDRPGIGRSDFQPGRTLLDWPEDVRAVADALGVDQFTVVGASAGGPYAAACAFRLPDRVRALGLISSLAPFDDPEISKGMTPAYRLIPLLAQRAPGLLSFFQSFLLRNPEGAWKQIYNRLPPCDRAILQAHPEWDLKASLLGDLPEIYRQGSQGVVWDMRILTRPWGFHPAAIQVKTVLWHGEQDVNVPITMGRYLTQTIPDCQARFIPNEGHLLYLNHWGEILADLV